MYKGQIGVLTGPLHHRYSYNTVIDLSTVNEYTVLIRITVNLL